MTKSIFLALSSAAVLLATSPDVFGGTARFLPDSARAFFPPPDTSATISFAVEGIGEGATVEYLTSDYQEKPEASGRVKVSGGRVDIPVKLPQGYHEIQFPGFGKTFGLIAMPDQPAAREGFWCIDAGLTWSKWRPGFKSEMVRLLTEKGMADFRDRLPWPEVETENGLVLEQNRTAMVRDEVYRDNIGNRMLELFQDSPPHLRRDKENPFSVDLGKSFLSWRKIAERYKGAWSALELWNEPFYAKGLPADQYVPVAKMAAAAAPQTKVVAGCFSPSIAVSYLEDCAKNGLLDAIDAVTLHLYGPPESMPDLLLFYRNFLKQYHRESLPLWVSESGDPDTLGGSGRPSGEDDRTSSMKTVMRAVECKAYGVERFYAFYLQKHIEGVISWGMTGEEGGPQRRLAAWLYAAQKVGDLPVIGDLKQVPKGAVSCHVFGNEQNAVVALFAPGRAAVRLPFVPSEITGADGRAFARNADGSIPVPDGIVYLALPRGEIEAFLDARCQAMVATSEAGHGSKPRKTHTLVVQPEYSRKQTAQVSNLGHFIEAETSAEYVAAAYVSNLSESAQKVRVTLEVPGLETKSREVLLAPFASERVGWSLDLRPVLAPRSRTPLIFRAKSDTDEDSVSVFLQPQPATRIYQVQKSARPPEIDGSPGDPGWQAAEKTGTLDCLDDAPDGKPVDRTGLDGVARFLWDDVGLYFLIEVDDDVQEAPESQALSWRRDSVQIAFHQENSPQDTNSFEWGFFLDGTGKAQKVLFRTSRGKPLSDATRIAISRDEAAKRTTYEGVIPWLDLGSMQAINDRAASRFRLSFIINDGNGGKRRWLEWSPGIAKGKNPADYPELILADENAPSLLDGKTESAPFSTTSGWEMKGKEKFQSLVFQDRPALKILDWKRASFSRDIGPLKMDRPLSFSFRLAVTDFQKNSPSGFCLKAALWNSKTNEGFECWVAPDGHLFSDKTGLAIADHDGMILKLGTGGAKLPPDGNLHKVTLSIDPVSRILRLFLERKGGDVLIAEGRSKRSVDGIDRLSFSTSGWGSGNLILSDIAVRE